MSSPVTFCNVPVSTRFDGQALRSCVSLDWVINSGLHTRTSQLSGLLTLPCHAAVISMCLTGVPVTASLTSDLVLGLDWLHSVQNSDPELVVHLSCGRKLGSVYAPPSSTGTYLHIPGIPTSCIGVTKKHWCGALISVHGWIWCSILPLVNASYARAPAISYARAPSILYARWSVPYAGHF
ncbi:hypothetical protein DFH07DRAFT_980644 [Mycena maculata]|uniref:Uncharacterized protein n=1 Tax=Mycena maculata TaxID=230809 RepID=A0AAD7K1P3_9AGAR|nr:hypothetical protein DFH07DRAFT_980644 [Mycena maculata]